MHPMSKSLPYDSEQFAHYVDQLILVGGELAARGWTPATSGNFSCRIDASHVAITVSGRDKGNLKHADIMVVDLDARPVASDRKASAETLLHTQLYKRLPQIGCVLHTHSQTQTLASRLYANPGHVHLRGYELLKAFNGITTHAADLDVPVFANSQDMHLLAAQVDEHLNQPPIWGYLIESHGLYAWGRDVLETRRHLEAFEFLFSCELELRKLAPELQHQSVGSK